MTLRPAEERGHANYGWLDSRYSFSFANYYDPEHMHWGPLRVINDDCVQPGEGFGTHSHQDMEIVSYVLAGALGHKDSMGNASSIVPGDVQRMSAGTGVTHSEFNLETAGVTRFLQIWFLPAQTGLTPSYEQKTYTDADKRGRLRLVVSPDGRDDSVTIHQDACMYAGLFDGDETAEYHFAAGRLGYLHVAQGSVTINDHALSAGDALLFKDEPTATIGSGKQAEILLFDLPVL